MANNPDWKSLMDDCLAELMSSAIAKNSSAATNTSLNNQSVTQSTKVTQTSTSAHLQSSLPPGTDSNVSNGTYTVTYADVASVDNVKSPAAVDDALYSSTYTTISTNDTREKEKMKKKSLWAKIMKPSNKNKKSKTSLQTSANSSEHLSNLPPLPPKQIQPTTRKLRPLPAAPNEAAVLSSPGAKGQGDAIQSQSSMASATSVDSGIQSGESLTQLSEAREMPEDNKSSEDTDQYIDDDFEEYISEDEEPTQFSEACRSPTDIVLIHSDDYGDAIHISPSSILEDVFDSDICRNKFGVKCMNKCSCKSLRFNKPYLWVKLLKDPAPDIVSLSDDDNEILEKLYCSPYVDEQSVALNENRTLHFDFNNMQMIKENGSSVDLCRLCTASATCMDDDPTCTRWVWYHQEGEDDNWRLFSSTDTRSALAFQYEIEGRYQAGYKSFTYTNKYSTYLINFKDMTRTTETAQHVTSVKRRPYYNTYLSGRKAKSEEVQGDDWFLQQKWQWIDFCNQVHYFSREEAAELEAMYCDPRRTAVALYLEGGMRYWTADFKSMAVTSEPGKLVRVDELFGSSDSADASEEWIWYWQDYESQWVPYPSEDVSTAIITSQYLEACRRKNQLITGFEYNGKNYKLKIDLLTQTNMHTEKVREIRRRPKLHHSSERAVWVWYWKDNQDKWMAYQEWDMSELRLTSHRFEQSFQEGERKVTLQGLHDTHVLDFTELVQLNKRTGTVREIKREKRRFTQECSPYPPHWNERLDYHTCWQRHVDSAFLARMSTSDVSEVQEVMECFRASLPGKEIVQFDCIQNYNLYDDYVSKKDKLKRKWDTQAVEEKVLFHGTKQACVDNIIHQGFDFRLAGSSTGTRYGKGAYFARDASYSNKYTDDGTMLVAKVLVGKCTSGKRDIPRPPEYSQGRLYDSCVNDEANPTIFVIFDIDQAYPAYLIKYK